MRVTPQLRQELSFIGLMAKFGLPEYTAMQMILGAVNDQMERQAARRPGDRMQANSIIEKIASEGIQEGTDPDQLGAYATTLASAAGLNPRQTRRVERAAGNFGGASTDTDIDEEDMAVFEEEFAPRMQELMSNPTFLEERDFPNRAAIRERLKQDKPIDPEDNEKFDQLFDIAFDRQMFDRGGEQYEAYQKALTKGRDVEDKGGSSLLAKGVGGAAILGAGYGVAKKTGLASKLSSFLGRTPATPGTPPVSQAVQAVDAAVKGGAQSFEHAAARQGMGWLGEAGSARAGLAGNLGLLAGAGIAAHGLGNLAINKGIKVAEDREADLVDADESQMEAWAQMVSQGRLDLNEFDDRVKSLTTVPSPNLAERIGLGMFSDRPRYTDEEVERLRHRASALRGLLTRRSTLSSWRS